MAAIKIENPMEDIVYMLIIIVYMYVRKISVNRNRKQVVGNWEVTSKVKIYACLELQRGQVSGKKKKI